MVWTSYDSRTGIRTYSASKPTALAPGSRDASDYVYTSKTGGGVSRWDYVPDAPSSNNTGTAVAPPPAADVVTGIDPSELHSALYGKPIPLSALGLARIGTAGLIFGPYFNAGSASFAVSFGFPANVEGTRRVYEIALNGKVAWELAAGSGEGDIDDAGFLAEPFMCRFYTGTQTQPADPLEVAVFGAQAVAYRPQMMLWFAQLPLAQFDGKVPYVSCKIGDVTDAAVPADGINLGECLERIAYSPWLEMDDTFEAVGVTDIVGAMILTEDQSFLNMLQVATRVYRTIDILQSDMLRVVDRGAIVTPDLTLDRDRIVGEAGVSYTRQEEASVARELELTTIDPDADYVFMPSKAARPRAPVPVTSSVGKDSIVLPVVIGATTRASLVTFDKYAEDQARKRVSLQTMLYGYELEPGDLFRLDSVADGYDTSEVWKVIETSHGANYVNELTAEAILKCALAFDEAPEGGDPYWTYVVLLLGFEGADGSTGAPGMTDESPQLHGNAAVFVGAQIDVSEAKFGGSSLMAIGSTGTRITFNNSADWVLSSANSDQFTVELWAKTTTTTPSGKIMLWYSATIGSQSWGFRVNSGGQLEFLGSSSGTGFEWFVTSSGLTWATDRWYHLAADKDATGKIRIYRDGVMLASSTPANSAMFAPSTFLFVGAAVSSNHWDGWLDEIRITKGIARYAASSYAVPAAAFPREA